MRFVLLSLVGVAVWANEHSSELPSSSIIRDPHTTLVLWGTRHGNRNPGQFLKQNPRSWGFEGANELTQFGKRQALGLGKELRKFVGDLVDENYLPGEVKYYSSSANRCQMTLQTILDYVANNTGWNASISNTADVADNFIIIDLHKSQYPDWVERPTLEGFTKESVIKAIHSFAENHQIKCAEYEPCRNMMGGWWLRHILQTIENNLNGRGQKVVGYASHTEVTLALMKLLGIDKEELTTSAGFVLEFRQKPKPQVRLLNHDPVDVDAHVIYQAKYNRKLQVHAESNGWVDLAKFRSVVQGETISDWQATCQIPGKTCPK